MEGHTVGSAKVLNLQHFCFIGHITRNVFFSFSNKAIFHASPEWTRRRVKFNGASGFCVVGVGGHCSERFVSGRWLMPAQVRGKVFDLKCSWLLVTLFYASTAFLVIWPILAPLGTVWESTHLIDICRLLSIAIIPSGNYGDDLIQHSNCWKRIPTVGWHDAKEDGCFSACLQQL